MCDISTLSAADAVPVDVIDSAKADYMDDTDEELMLQYSPKQHWYYLPGQLPTELLIFKTVDSHIEEGASSGNVSSYLIFYIFISASLHRPQVPHTQPSISILHIRVPPLARASSSAPWFVGKCTVAMGDSD
jgi:hypothetical protein